MLRPLWEKARGSHLAKNALWLLLGQGARLPVQGLYFVLMARSLGVQGYGAFLGVTALVAIVAPFAGVGSGNILVKNVARDPSSFGGCWGKTLVLNGVTGVLLAAAVLACSRFLLPPSIPFTLVLCVACADLVFARFVDASCLAYQAFQRLARTSLLSFLPFLARLVALLLLLWRSGTPSPQQWGCCYLASIVCCAAVALTMVHRELGPPSCPDRLCRDLREGIYFSVSTSSLNIYNDLDKSLLSRFSTLGAVGVYGAAYRVVDVAFTPVRSLLGASYARFFQNGAGGMRGSLSFAARLFPYAAGYGLLSSLVIFLAAPLLPMVLGRQYLETVAALRWLSLLPVLKSAHNLAADALTGAGRQGVRSGCQIVTALLNGTLTLWLIRGYSWRGAAWASLATDSFLAAALWLVILRLVRAERVAAGRDAALRGGAGMERA